MAAARTIVALSSGALPAGVAVIRLSGPQAIEIINKIASPVPVARQFVLRDICDFDGKPLDRGLVCVFPAPNSFTGEDCAELHLHGSRAVVKAVLDLLAGIEGVALAKPGEFTRRAYEAGKLDLTAVEGLADLIDAETEDQRQIALARASGTLSAQVDEWCDQLIGLLAEVEARLDFEDEGDVPDVLPERFHEDIATLRSAWTEALGGIDGGRIVREGFRVALGGAPNAGKSALLNRLTKSDLAIVSDEAGTTRDVREVPLDLGGQLVLLYDLAGLRESASVAESEGVRRAETAMREADLVLWLRAPDATDVSKPADISARIVEIASKSDLGDEEGSELSVSSVTGAGLDALLSLIGDEAASARRGQSLILSRRRDKEALEKALQALDLSGIEEPASELLAEALRQAVRSLDRLVGRIDAELVLDRLFAGFCIGK